MSFISKLNTCSAYVRASAAYVRTLIGPGDRVDSLCSRGHVVLKNWDKCPQCQLINRTEDMRKEKFINSSKAPRLGLYCVMGANKGRTFLISKERTSIGCEADSDIVLTPQSLNTRASYQILINGKIKLSSSETQFFKLNGQLQQH